MEAGALVGAYRVISPIGDGGMGQVWLAEHTMLGRRAAVKVLHKELSGRQELVTRFFNEARAATAISDPGIVQIFDFGYHTDGSAYIVMELLEGEPLDVRLRRRGALDLEQALRIVRQVATSLGAAHARGIVHRDLKPENVFLVRDSEVVGGERAKVLDFGIAKLTNDAQTSRTNTSLVLGTPMFMSPEQCKGAGHVDHRSDIYSLGCVLFTLLCARPPFEAEGAGELIAMHLREPPPSLLARIPGMRPEVDAIVQRCLAKNPADRFPSTRELVAALGEALHARAPTGGGLGHGSPMAMGPVPTPMGAIPTPMPNMSSGGMPVAMPPHVTPTGMRSNAPTTLSSAAGESPGAGPSSRRMVPIIGGLLIGGGVVAFLVLRGGGSDGGTTPEPAGVAASPSATPAAAASPPSPSEPVAPRPSAVDSQAQAPAPPPAVAEAPKAARPEDPMLALDGVFTATIARFAAWTKDHAGAPCPDAGALAAAPDPWGHTLRVTCTDQPSDQIIGITSDGPDGKASTADDVMTWQRGIDVRGPLKGGRWRVKVASAPRRTSPAPAPGSSSSLIVDPFATPAAKQPAGKQPAAKQAPAKQPGKVELDADGLPIRR